MAVRSPRLLVLSALLPLAAACGAPGAPSAGSGVGAAAAAVEVAGQVSATGTKGSVLVFAYSGAVAPAALPEEAPLAVGTVEADGTFLLTVAPSEALTLAFLADGASDGVIDGGDPVVVLTDARLANLPAGTTVHLTEVGLDFRASTARAASIDVHRPGEAIATPTAIPAS